MSSALFLGWPGLATPHCSSDGVIDSIKFSLDPGAFKMEPEEMRRFAAPIEKLIGVKAKGNKQTFNWSRNGRRLKFHTGYEGVMPVAIVTIRPAKEK